MSKRTNENERWKFEEDLVRKAHRVIWEHPVDKFYTDHGMGHSKRVCDLALGLVKIYKASGYERHLLRQAAYIHDIGMQYNNWARQATNNKSETIADALKLPKPPLATDEVRRRHVEFGQKLATAEFSDRRTWSALPPLCSADFEAKNALFQASLVAFAHSKGETWDNFHKPNPTLDRRNDSNENPLRLRLLAGLFRLADELDGNRLRVPRVDQLFEEGLPDESRRHWLACFFVESVLIEEDVDSGLRIRIKWRVPIGVDSATRHLIREFLLDRRLRRIKTTISEVSEMFRMGGEGGFARNIEVMGLQDEPIEFPISIDERLRALVSSDMRSQNLIGDRVEDHGVVAESSGISRELEEWFYSNHQLGHFLLAGGLHTDTLVQCRSWIANRKLLLVVSRMIVEELKKGAVQPDLVVGVGSSAIPVAVETALLLGCRVTFTFGRVPPQVSDEIPRHPDWEVTPVTSGAEEHILVIDDIISFGNTAKQVIESLRKSSQRAQSAEPTITHCALLRLGSENLTVVPDVHYLYLCHIPNVRYRSSASECEQCQQAIPLTPEWKL